MANTPTLDRFVNEVILVLDQNQIRPQQLDLTFLIAFFKELVTLFKDCGESAESAEFRARRMGVGIRGRADNIRLWRMVRRDFSNEEEAKVVVDIVKGVGEDLTVTDFKNLYREV